MSYEPHTVLFDVCFPLAPPPPCNNCHLNFKRRQRARVPRLGNDGTNLYTSQQKKVDYERTKTSISLDRELGGKKIIEANRARIKLLPHMLQATWETWFLSFTSISHMPNKNTPPSPFTNCTPNYLLLSHPPTPLPLPPILLLIRYVPPSPSNSGRQNESGQEGYRDKYAWKSNCTCPSRVPQGRQLVFLGLHFHFQGRFLPCTPYNKW